MCSAAGLKIVVYYHNEAQSGKHVCDTHFPINRHNLMPIWCSPPPAACYSSNDTAVCNTTVLLVKPDFRAPYHTTVIPSVHVHGISEFYAAQYIRTDGKQEIKFFNSLGQNVPSVSVSVPSCHACSLSTPMGSEDINFTGVTVLLSSDSEGTCVQARKDKSRYARRNKGMASERYSVWRSKEKVRML